MADVAETEEKNNQSDEITYIVCVWPRKHDETVCLAEKLLSTYGFQILGREEAYLCFEKLTELIEITYQKEQWAIMGEEGPLRKAAEVYEKGKMVTWLYLNGNPEEKDKLLELKEEIRGRMHCGKHCIHTIEESKDEIGAYTDSVHKILRGETKCKRRKIWYFKAFLIRALCMAKRII